MDVDAIFAADLERPPLERSLPWTEEKDGIIVVVEPKPHWADDLRAFRLADRSYCRYADWQLDGGAARFFRHPDATGEDVLTAAWAMILREIADGYWD